MSAGVEVDTTALVRGMRTLARELESGSQSAARASAESCAADIAARLPRRTGALAASVRTQAVTGGFGVSYGIGLRYAGYIERRTGTVETAAANAAPRFQQAEVKAAQQAAGRV